MARAPGSMSRCIRCPPNTASESSARLRNGQWKRPSSHLAWPLAFSGWVNLAAGCLAKLEYTPVTRPSAAAQSCSVAWPGLAAFRLLAVPPASSTAVPLKIAGPSPRSCETACSIYRAKVSPGSRFCDATGRSIKRCTFFCVDCLCAGKLARMRVLACMGLRGANTTKQGSL